MFPINAALVQPVAPLLREGAGEGLKALAGMVTLAGVGAALAVGCAAGYGLWRGARKVAPPIGRLLHRVNPVRIASEKVVNFIGQEVDQRIDAMLTATRDHAIASAAEPVGTA